MSGWSWKVGCCGAGESRSGSLAIPVACPKLFVLRTILVDALWHSLLTINQFSQGHAWMGRRSTYLDNSKGLDLPSLPSKNSEQ